MIYQAEGEGLLSTSDNLSKYFPAGTRSSCCNGNYVLLSFILEDIFGKTFGELLQEKISKPLGLKDTYVWTGADESKGECRSYKYAGDWELLAQPSGQNALVLDYPRWSGVSF